MPLPPGSPVVTAARNRAASGGRIIPPAPVRGPLLSPCFGHHGSHELFVPARLLGLAELAYGAGFRVASASDHFHPWSVVEQGWSGFA